MDERHRRSRPRIRITRLAALSGFVAGVLLVGACAAAPRGPAAREPDVAAADVDFIRGMIVHHAQALAMVELVPARTGREDIRVLARRIQASQSVEIDLLRDWLERRGLEDDRPPS